MGALRSSLIFCVLFGSVIGAGYFIRHITRPVESKRTIYEDLVSLPDFQGDEPLPEPYYPINRYDDLDWDEYENDIQFPPKPPQKPKTKPRKPKTEFLTFEKS